VTFYAGSRSSEAIKCGENPNRKKQLHARRTGRVKRLQLVLYSTRADCLLPYGLDDVTAPVVHDEMQPGD